MVCGEKESCTVRMHVCGMNCSVGYDSALRCSVWESLVHDHIIVECDFVGVRIVTFLFGMGVE